DSYTNLFSSKGHEKYVSENIYFRKYKPFIGFLITNFNDFKFADNDYYITNMLAYLGWFIRKNFKNNVSFCFSNGIFIIYLKDYDDINKSIEKIQKYLDVPFVLEDYSFNFEVSFFYDGKLEFDNYFDLKDTLYIAIEKARKPSGNTVFEITEDIRQEAVKRKNIEVALKEALVNEDNVLVYYQPIFSSSEEKVVAAEALVRLYDEKNDTIIYPDDFINLAEKNRSIIKLGMIIMKKVCQTIHDVYFSKFGIKVIEINLSPYQCAYDKLADDFIGIMESYKIDPKMIGLELTESGTMNETVLYNNVKRLMEYGICFALDDYGTGYSNLVNMLSIPFYIVKIDKSICWDYFNNNNKLLLEVIEQFKTRNMNIVVEGVETEYMAKKLKELNVEYQQGFYYSKPIPVSEFIEYLKK
nr:EAL domain-containing protein [Butyrivibrio sp.]